MKKKTFSIIFKGFSVVKNCLRPESGPLPKKLKLPRVIFPSKQRLPTVNMDFSSHSKSNVKRQF